MGVNLKVFKEKEKGSDRDVSTIVLRIFFFRIFLFILSTSDGMVYQVMALVNLEFFNDAKFYSSCGLVQFWRYRKTHSCMLFPNCTRNHAITYTYIELSRIKIPIRYFVPSICGIGVKISGLLPSNVAK